MTSTDTRPEQQLTAAIYDSLAQFQMTAQLSSLQHAQMRQYLAEHLAGALAAAGWTPEGEGRSKGIADAAAWLHETGETNAAYLLRTVDVPAAEETHVVADDSDDPEHTDDCPGCEAFTLTGHRAAKGAQR
ncbi:hypothetical protein [Streptomyces triticiradicis]|uniref:Uncharacterized protein n=1 Tax=Streptomyces triticiradicis TaxID=2651189 RepID=A0A7J5D511_9ACTN|nr:hypothetical protein [Streptomyces triticiradicis]KAB1979253.1 hypothetical protein F8144_36425 [Streptomyces triticiradicis]